FRGTFALAAVPLLLVPLLGRWMAEPDRYRAVAHPPSSRARAAVPRALDGDGRRRLVTMVAVALAAAFVTGPANSFLFLYAEGVLGVSASVTAVILVAALPVGLAGLVLGRSGADRWGRRPTAALALSGIAGAAALTYRGGVTSTVVGALLTVLAGYAFAPVLAAMANELFPTAVRGAVAGVLVASGVVGAVAGLVAFGALADLLDGFRVAAVIVAAPALAATALFARLPETRGLELEESSDSSLR
ncbi:MAG TPA: MFS transporter, partial [Acidimicrobiales bacterium]|nr:MFS transporter [Acidimicrobiales bacterium]